MRFVRLRLNGFKSFVDPTELVISDGLTGVVGPNGCGKSNLLEALRWVMGEGRASAMRGAGMEDVIFAGTTTRPARAFAEVALSIDNSDRRAPAAFNDADAFDVVRRITRDAGSAYRLGGREVRARDVQMLFADASTGAASPALVRQGQISELINARPSARRRILEEAAGIAGLTQRRHEAELRLKAAESNLARIEDVAGALDQQRQALMRQARAARRYREIGVELRRAEGLLFWRRWHEAEAARAEAEVALRAARQVAAEAERAARGAEAARAGAEAALPPLREEAAIAAALCQRLDAALGALQAEEAQARARVTELQAALDQAREDAAREAALTRDAAETLRRLQAEAQTLSEAAPDEAPRLAAAEAEARAAAAALAEAEAALGAATEDAARLEAQHQSLGRLTEESARRLATAEAEGARARAARIAAEAARQRATEDLATAEAEAARARATATEADQTLTLAETARAEVQAREAEARARAAEAGGEAAALRAEAAALARLVEREGQAGGQLMDQLSVPPGLEVALGAALADDLRAPVLPGGAGSGWIALDPYDLDQPLPEGAQPLMAGPPVLARRLAQTGLVPDLSTGDRLQPALRPGQRLVTAGGDLWRWDGLRIAARDAPSAAALRLQQINRLAFLKQDLTEAVARAEGATQAHDHLRARLAELSSAEAMARGARREADRLASDLARRLSRAEADRDLAEAKAEAAESALEHQAEAAEAARAALAERQAEAQDLPDLTEARQRLTAWRARVEAARAQLLATRAAADGLRRDAQARARRVAAVQTDLAAWTTRAATAETRAQDLAARAEATEAALVEARAAPQAAAGRLAALTEDRAGAALRDQRARAALEAAEAALRDAAEAERQSERAAADARAALAVAGTRHEGAGAQVTEAAARLEEAMGCAPEALLAALQAQSGEETGPIPDAATLETQAAALRRARDALGAVNLRADEDLTALEAEQAALAREREDLDGAIRTLRLGIAGLNREGRERLLTAFEQVNANFALLFTHLFGGGEARLTLVESDDPLEAGLEILCQPPGKKLSTLSLLSGGEQTLTALALIFGVFLANPAPICVLDEVDAPLDDANVTRFCDLMDEMVRRTATRFLVITHHAVTMARMDRLFGVTMAEQGISQLVSVDLRKAEALVA